MNQRERYSIIISGMCIVIGLPVMWFSSYLLLKNVGLILWLGGTISMTITMLRSFSH